MLTLLKPSESGPDKILLRHWKNAWDLKAPTRGTIFLVHGIGEHSGRYDEIASYLTQWGFDVLAFDLPGHGMTARKGGYLRLADFNEMLKELKGVARYWMVEGPQASPELRAKPLFLMGHSMGALLSLLWLTTEQATADFPFYPKKVLLSAPPVSLSLKVPLWKEIAAEVLRTTVPDIKLGNEITPDFLSHDRVKTFDYVQDRLRMSKASPRLYTSMKKTMSLVRSQALNIQVPLMLLSGSRDPIVDQQALKQFYEDLNTHKKWMQFQGMLHESFNEIGREKVFEEVVKWFLV